MQLLTKKTQKLVEIGVRHLVTRVGVVLPERQFMHHDRCTCSLYVFSQRYLRRKADESTPHVARAYRLAHLSSSS